jgi:hypothetical protein
MSTKFAGSTKLVAICPDCEAYRDMDAMPRPGDFWPECRECGIAMNIYERNSRAALKDAET